MGGECIYPGPHGAMSDEHHLPAALGTFRGYELLKDRVCRNCNTTIGNAVETEFLRTGAIVLFRWMLGIDGRDGPPPSPFYNRATGLPPIRMTGRLPGFDYDLLLDLDPGTEQVYPLRQVVFAHPLFPTPRAVPIDNRMRDRPEFLMELLLEWGLDRGQPIRAFAAPDEIPWVSALLQGLGYVIPPELAVTQFNAQQLAVVAEVVATEAHFRAVAKIAFHYALKMFPDLTGMEPEFAPIKDYIWAGGDGARFVEQRRDQFVSNFRRGYRPTKWMHTLAVERTYDVILAHAQFFAGPHMLPPPYVVRIGRDPARIVRRKETRAHMFVMLDPAAGIGEMVDADPAQLVWSP